MPQHPVAKPKRPAHLPHGRWLGDFEPLSAFERKLVKACAQGEICKPDNWDRTRPEAEAATEANTIRAEIIRFLALGGDDKHPVHQEGVMLQGGWIKGKISLNQATAVTRLDLKFCLFEKALSFVAAILPELALSGSKTPGLNADRLKVTGAVFLRDGFEATGEVRLLGAEIDGGLTCTNGKFNNPTGKALHAGLMVVNGSVFLSDGFESIGEVQLLGAQINGSLSLTNGTFNNPKGRALNADRLVVTGSMFLRRAAIKGGVSLVSARIGTIADGIDCWQAGGHIFDGLLYDRIIGPTDATMRIGWLQTQDEDQLGYGFAPQPWEQLIKTLREMGHPYDAAQVAIAKQKQLRKAGKIEGSARKTLHWLYGFLADYGYQPFKLVQWMTCLWLACAFFFSVGGSYGYIGPGTPLLNNPELAASIDENCGHRREGAKQVWTKCTSMPAEFTTFQPLLYSLDLILPLVDLQQDSDWAPIVEEAPGVNMGYGVFLRWLMWFEILFGWVASLMLVAILGRLVEKD